jgi:hypothetical protein
MERFLEVYSEKQSHMNDDRLSENKSATLLGSKLGKKVDIVVEHNEHEHHDSDSENSEEGGFKDEMAVAKPKLTRE